MLENNEFNLKCRLWNRGSSCIWDQIDLFSVSPLSKFQPDQLSCPPALPIYKITVSVDKSAIKPRQSLNSEGSLNLSDFHHDCSSEIVVRIFLSAAGVCVRLRFEIAFDTHTARVDHWTNPRIEFVTCSKVKYKETSFFLSFSLSLSLPPFPLNGFIHRHETTFFISPTAGEGKAISENRGKWEITHLGPLLV